MSQPIQRFNSRAEVEKWIDECIASGMSTQLIFALIQKKAEELSDKKAHYLLERREALVNGNTTVATELHALMKECEAEMRLFNEVCGSVEVSRPEVSERVVTREAKDELAQDLINRLN